MTSLNTDLISNAVILLGILFLGCWIIGWSREDD